jgi:hypothetical protein
MDLRQDNLSTRGEGSTGRVSSGRHLAGIPTRVPTGSLRLQVDGHVQRSLALSLDDLRRFEPFLSCPKIQLAFFGHFRVKRNSHTKTMSELVS